MFLTSFSQSSSLSRQSVLSERVDVSLLEGVIYRSSGYRFQVQVFKGVQNNSQQG